MLECVKLKLEAVCAFSLHIVWALPELDKFVVFEFD